MAAANESQGLKIAVAAFVSLSVILAVTSYFMYSNYSQAAVKAADEENKAREAQKVAADALRNRTNALEKVGGPELAKRGDTVDAVNKAINDETKRWEQKLTQKSAELSKALTAGPGQTQRSQEVERARELAEKALSGVTSEPQATYNSRIDRMVDLVAAQTELSIALLGDNADLRQTLEGVNATNEAKVKQAEETAKKARDEQIAEHSTYEGERKSFLDKLASFQEQNGKQAAEVTSLKGDIERINQENEKRSKELTAMIRELKQQLSKEEGVIQRAQGVVTYVDYTRKELRTTLNRGNGAHEQQRFQVFNHDAGIPTDRSKATIELVSVNDRDSVAKILSQVADINPIRVGDKLYSAAFGQKRFALVGRLDLNRDGKDDRDVVRRMISAAGGVVVYDLAPPPFQQERGELSAQTDWVVTDDATGRERRSNEIRKDDAEFLAKKSAMVSKARDLGVAPMPLSKLASYLGYNPSMAMPGRVESLDAGRSRMLQNPLGRTGPPLAPVAPPAEKKDEGDDAEPK